MIFLTVIFHKVQALPGHQKVIVKAVNRLIHSPKDAFPLINPTSLARVYQKKQVIDFPFLYCWSKPQFSVIHIHSLGKNTVYISCDLRIRSIPLPLTSCRNGQFHSHSVHTFRNLDFCADGKIGTVLSCQIFWINHRPASGVHFHFVCNRKMAFPSLPAANLNLIYVAMHIQLPYYLSYSFPYKKHRHPLLILSSFKNRLFS